MYLVVYSVVGVGGDGLFNELMNGLLVHAQFCAGVNLRRQRFIPVQPNLRIGMIPCGHTNTVAHSVLSSPNPVTAATQIILGKSLIAIYLSASKLTLPGHHSYHAAPTYVHTYAIL